jgi:hypothetical protein
MPEKSVTGSDRALFKRRLLIKRSPHVVTSQLELDFCDIDSAALSMMGYRQRHLESQLSVLANG